jgi:GNAT superfamily N-acetyltransferase
MDISDYFNFQDLSLQHIETLDIATAVKMINTAYLYQEQATGTARTSAERLHERIDASVVYVVKQPDGAIVGCVYIEPIDDGFHLGLFAVSNERRGTGLADAIFMAVEKFTKASNMHLLELDYMSIAPWLKPYYQKRGYIETGQIRPWNDIELIQMIKQI